MQIMNPTTPQGLTSPSAWNPVNAMNPLTSVFAPHNMVLGAMGKGGNKQPGTAYGINELDIPSANARDVVQKYLMSGQAEDESRYGAQIQRGIQNRVAAKMMENSRQVGPHLAATEVKGIPDFLKSGNPMIYSGADRGTDHGAALEAAMKEGKMNTPEIQVDLGAKGTSRGLAKEDIPQYQPRQGIDPLMPLDQLYADAQNRAGTMNQKSAKAK